MFLRAASKLVWLCAIFVKRLTSHKSLLGKLKLCRVRSVVLFTKHRKGFLRSYGCLRDYQSELGCPRHRYFK